MCPVSGRQAAAAGTHAAASAVARRERGGGVAYDGCGVVHAACLCAVVTWPAGRGARRLCGGYQRSNVGQSGGRSGVIVAAPWTSLRSTRTN